MSRGHGLFGVHFIATGSWVKLPMPLQSFKLQWLYSSVSGHLHRTQVFMGLNWSTLGVGGSSIIGVLYYFARGRSFYTGPIRELTEEALTSPRVD
jgi:hypothetical protein